MMKMDNLVMNKGRKIKMLHKGIIIMLIRDIKDHLGMIV